MAAPTLQAEAAAFTVVTTGACAPTIPAHVADDILLATVMVWVPSTASAIADIPTEANWNKLGSVDLNGATKDGQIAWFWRRATASGTTVSFARGASWDTGTDSAYGARVDVIRGCITTGNPYDAFAASTQYTTANQNTPAVTVSGAERLVMFFEAHCVDSASAQFTARTNFTMGTHRGATTGTGGGAQNARRETGSSEAATATTHAAPAAGRFYAFGGISFKPPEAATVERSAAIGATGAITASGTFFSIFDRSAAVSATADIASAGSGFTLFTASAAIDAAGAIASSGTFWTTFDRSASLDGAGAVTTAHQRELFRQATLDAAGGIASSGSFWTIFERAAAIEATGGIASDGTFFSILERAAAIDAVAGIVSAPQRDLLRALALAATADINATGQVGDAPVTHDRSATFGAAAAIDSSAIFWSILERVVSLGATGSLAAVGQRDLLRAAQLEAVASLATSGQRDLSRSAALSALAAISAAGAVPVDWSYDDDPNWHYTDLATFAYTGGTVSTYGGDPDWTYHGGD
jgi:hypothetical protein